MTSTTSANSVLTAGFTSRSKKACLASNKPAVSPTTGSKLTLNPSRVGTPGVKVEVSVQSAVAIIVSPNGQKIEALDTSVDESATQERNSDFSCIEKVGVKSLPEKIVADLDPSIRVNLENSVLSESPKFKNIGLPTFDATGIHNINFAPSTREKSLNWKRLLGWGISMILKE